MIDFKANFAESLDLGGFLIKIKKIVISQNINKKLQPVKIATKKSIDIK